MLLSEEVLENGDCEISRNFSYIENAVQAYMLAPTKHNPDSVSHVYNIALGEPTLLDDFYTLIAASLSQHGQLSPAKLSYRAFPVDDVRRSLTNMSKAQIVLGYDRTTKVGAGVAAVMLWHASKVTAK